MALTVARLFRAASLKPSGCVPWGAAIPDGRPGVYVVALIQSLKSLCQRLDVSYLPAHERCHWIDGHPVIYIGRTKRSLACRVDEFYRHKLNHQAPHRGGQAVKRLKCALWVYWSATDDPHGAERAMIDAFREDAGRLPFANRRR